MGPHRLIKFWYNRTLCMRDIHVCDNGHLHMCITLCTMYECSFTFTEIFYHALFFQNCAVMPAKTKSEGVSNLYIHICVYTCIYKERE